MSTLPVSRTPSAPPAASIFWRDNKIEQPQSRHSGGRDEGRLRPGSPSRRARVGFSTPEKKLRRWENKENPCKVLHSSFPAPKLRYKLVPFYHESCSSKSCDGGGGADGGRRRGREGHLCRRRAISAGDNPPPPPWVSAPHPPRPPTDPARRPPHPEALASLTAWGGGKGQRTAHARSRMAPGRPCRVDSQAGLPSRAGAAWWFGVEGAAKWAAACPPCLQGSENGRQGRGLRSGRDLFHPLLGQCGWGCAVELWVRTF